MSFLTVQPLGGGSTITLDVSADGGASELAPVRIGSASRSMSGSFRSDIRTEKREWSFVLAMQAIGLFETFRTMVKNGAFLTVAGDAVVPSSGFAAVIDIGECSFVESSPTTEGYLKRAALTVRTI
jgi:hypothetical protein